MFFVQVYGVCQHTGSMEISWLYVSLNSVKKQQVLQILSILYDYHLATILYDYHLARFVLFCLIKKRSFNLLCVLDLPFSLLGFTGR